MKKFLALVVCVLALHVTLYTLHGVAAEPAKEKGLIAYWSFDEGKGAKAKDMSGNGLDVEIGSCEWAKGKVGGALLFNGVDSVIPIDGGENKLAMSKAFTISAWAKFNDLENYQEIFNDNQFFLRKDSPAEGDKFSLFVKTPDGSPEPRAQVAEIACEVDKWFFVAATWDGKACTIYLNGKAGGASDRVGPLTDELVTPTIGGGEQTNVSGNCFNGIIDELKIYNCCLTADEIKAAFSAAK